MDGAERVERSGWRLLALLGIGVGCCVFYVVLERAASGGLGLPLDDGWIHLTFARNLAAGDGMSYQGSRWVSGSTAPLWTALLSLAFLLPGPPVLWAKLLGVACYLLGALAMRRLGILLGLRGSLPWLAALLFVLTDWMVWGALSGMEIPLFVLLTLWGVELQARETRAGDTRRWAIPVLALACLVRPEGVLLLVLALAERWIRLEREVGGLRVGAAPGALRRLAAPIGAAVLASLPLAVFSWVAGGSILPTTFDAKLEAGHKWLPALRDLWLVAEILFRPLPFVFLLAGAGAVALVRRAGRRGGPGLLPLLWLLGLPCAYSLMAPAGRPLPVGNFGRYLFPLYPWLILLGVLGAQSLGRAAWSGWRWRRVRLPVPVLTCALLVVPTAQSTLSGASRHARNVANVTQSDVAAGRWIADHLPHDAVLGVQDVGAIAFLAPQPILDLVGIVTPEILDEDASGSPARSLAGLARRVEDRGVDYLVVFPESYGGAQTLERMFPGLRVVERFAVDDNITMAGSELVIYALPRSSAPRSPGLL